jgi:hypothetical protein
VKHLRSHAIQHRVDYFRAVLRRIVPRRLAEIAGRIKGIQFIEPPREIQDFPYFMAWHPRLATEQLTALTGFGGAKSAATRR